MASILDLATGPTWPGLQQPEQPSLASKVMSILPLMANRAADHVADSRAYNVGPRIKGAGKVVGLASSQLGAPYVWADINPAGVAGGPGAGFDCSGLTSWVYSRMGVNLPHNAAQQQRMARPVGAKQLRPGDLVFMWYQNDRGIPQGTASHVGIYAGNGTMIDAGGEGVQHEPVDWSAFIGGGRP